MSELPRRALTTYATDAICLEVCDAVLEREGDDVSLPEIDALEEVELAAFDEPRDADRDVLELLNRYYPEVRRDPEPRWWERAEALRDRPPPVTRAATTRSPPRSPRWAGP